MKKMPIFLLALFISAAWAGQALSAAPQGPDDRTLLWQARFILGQLPDKMPGGQNDTPEMAKLGEMLYFEQELSINRTQSCNTCHRLDNNKGGVDYLPTSKGAMAKFGPRNPPSTLNAGFQVAQFWDGRAADLEEQATGPMLNPMEMAMPSPAEAMARLKAMDKYRKAFAAAFPGDKDPVSIPNFASAVAAFERTLITRCRLDQFIEGRAEALTRGEKEGLELFFDRGCVRCHNGPTLGGVLFQKMGLVHPYADQEDTGRFNVTKREADRFVFKVPVLRNAAITGPYFHDGKVESLAEAVELMAWLQLDQRWSREDVLRMLRFLTALTDLKRYSAPPKAVDVQGTWWKPQDPTVLPGGKEGELIRRGFELVNDTNRLLGQGVKEEAQRYSGNELDCRHCHIEVGTQRFGNTWVGVANRYPQYRARKGAQAGLDDRVNGCLERSMNGRALPGDGPEMKAILAYLGWLSKDAPKTVVGTKFPPLAYPDRKADLEKGADQYQTYCLSCHGSDGGGYSNAQDITGLYMAPPVAGPDAYNNGAGMNRLLTAAAFIAGNMPLGAAWDRPVLTDEQAYDIAAHVGNQDRPLMDEERLAKDYPKKAEKPVDCPYPPYADDFSQEQHRFGPFQPIIEAMKAGKKN